MTADDLASVAELELQLFSHPHSYDQLVGFFEGGGECLVAADGRDVGGYAIARCAAGEADLIVIAVDRKARRKGVAATLLGMLIKCLQRRNTEQLFLEVRASNAAAIACYSKLGFEEIGCRRNYYPLSGGGREDALVFRRNTGV